MKIESAEFLLAATRQDQFRRDGLPELAFVGRSNVGKSSLLNRLLQRKGLARTSSTPGRTQTVNYFLVNRRVYFVDLPGFGYAKASKTDRQQWAELIESYLSFAGEKSSRRLGIIQLVDGKVGATELDVQAQEYFRSLGIEPTIVATKIDKVKRGERARRLVEIRQQLTLPDDAELFAVSAETGEGVQPLWKGILTFLGQTAETPQ